MSNPSESELLLNYRNALKDVIEERESKEFRIGLLLYVVINGCLVALNLLTNPDFLWFFFPMGFWGLGILFYFLRRNRERRDFEEADLRALHRISAI